MGRAEDPGVVRHRANVSAHEVPLLLRTRIDPVLEDIGVPGNGGHATFVIRKRLDGEAAGRDVAGLGVVAKLHGNPVERRFEWLLHHSTGGLMNFVS